MSTLLLLNFIEICEVFLLLINKLPKTFPVPNKTEIITILLLVFKKGYQHVLLIDKGCIFCFPDSDARFFYTVPHFLGLIINIRGLRILLSL